MDIFKASLAFCEKEGLCTLIKERKKVIIALSGGADSTALLYFMKALSEKLCDTELFAAHINHMIRGEESDSDEAFCRELCQRLSVPLYVCKKDVPALARESSMGLEEKAREVRYSFFKELSEKLGSALVATAHNADDNLETVLFNLARGSALKGISGISPLRDGIYIRPLLSLSGEDIRSFCKRENIPYVTDSTNTDTKYTRNSIRHEIVPRLKAINPKAQTAALRLCESAREDCDYMDSVAKGEVNGDSISLKRARELHPAILSRVILLLYKKKAGGLRDFSEKNLSDCKKLIFSAEGGRVSLPGGFSFFADRDIIYIERERANEEEIASPIPLETDILREFHSHCICISRDGQYIKDKVQNVYNLSLHAVADCDKIYGRLFLRGRLRGDTFFYHKMNRKLKKLLCDSDISRRERDSLPIIADDEGILCIPPFGVRDSARADDNCKAPLHIFILTKNTEKEEE